MQLHYDDWCIKIGQYNDHNNTPGISCLGVLECSWGYGTAVMMDCPMYAGKVPCNPTDPKCGKTPEPTPPPPPPMSQPGKGWSAAHNCTSCQTPPAAHCTLPEGPPPAQ